MLDPFTHTDLSPPPGVSPNVTEKLICLILAGAMLLVQAKGAIAQATGDPPSEVRVPGERPVSESLSELLSSPGLMTPIPSNDRPTRQDRARLFFEIGRCYYALADSGRAERALRYAYSLNPGLENEVLTQGGREFEQARHFVSDLGLTEKRQHYARTSKVKAAGRSLILPGWGQMYRGHRKRGLIALAATTVAGVFLAKSVSDYNRAKQAYDHTNIGELDLELLTETSDLPRPFETRYQTDQSKASTANTAAIVFAALWGAAVLDNLVLEPNRLELRWEFGE